MRQLLRGRSGGTRLGPSGRGPVPCQSCRRGSESCGGEAGTEPPAGVLEEAGAGGLARPGMPQTVGGSAGKPGTAAWACRSSEEKLELEVGRRSVRPQLGPPPPSPATNTTKTAPLLLADAMAAGMAPWNHNIALLWPRRSLGVLLPRSRS